MNSTTSTFAELLDRFEMLLDKLGSEARRLELKVTSPKSPCSTDVADQRPPHNLRDAVRRCFARLPVEFDTADALRLVDSRYPQFRNRDKSTRSQAVGIVANEFGATSIGKIGRNCCERYRKRGDA